MYNSPIKEKRARTTQQLDAMKNLLNSARIKATFGSYGIDVLLQNNKLRVSSLHADHVMKTCAVVNYADDIPSWLQQTHQTIYEGASIGETIEKTFNLTKEGFYLGETSIPSFAKIKMDSLEENAAVYIYKLLVQEPNTNNWFSYCVITEIYCPSYLMLGDLKKLYPETNNTITDELKNHFSQLNLLEIPTPIADIIAGLSPI